MVNELMRAIPLLIEEGNCAHQDVIRLHSFCDRSSVVSLKYLRQMVNADLASPSNHHVSSLWIQGQTVAGQLSNGSSVQDGPGRNVAGVSVLPHSDKALPAAPEESLVPLSVGARRPCCTRASE